jgi:hypothetical protein
MYPNYMKRKSGQNVTYAGSRTAKNILLGFDLYASLGILMHMNNT